MSWPKGVPQWNKGLTKESHPSVEKIAKGRRAAAARIRAELSLHINTPLKKCSACGLEKPRSEFAKFARTIDGLNYWCRPCHKAKRAAWHAAHKQDQNAKSKRYSRENATRIRENRVRRNSAHPEKVKEQVARYQTKHAERLRLKRMTPAARAKARAQGKRWRQNNLAQAREKGRREQAQRKYGARLNPVSYDDVYERDHGTCYLCCQPVDRKIAHFDHVIPLFRGGEHTYENIRPTHPRCNLRKGHNIVEAGAYVGQ